MESLPHARQRHVQQAQFAVERIVILECAVVRNESFFCASQKDGAPLAALTVMDAAQLGGFVSG